jgi:endonuclease G
MKKLIVVMLALIWPVAASAQNTPCSGKKSGISHCDGSKFVCNDGSYSKSKKVCSGRFEEKVNASNKTIRALGIDTSDSENAKEKIIRLGGVLKIDYQGFIVWLDCKEHSAVKFQYNAQHDTGKEARAKNFKLDQNVPHECQQTSTAAYGQGYDRGRNR